MSSNARWAVATSIVIAAAVLVAVYFRFRPLSVTPESATAISEAVVPIPDEIPLTGTVTAAEPSMTSPASEAPAVPETSDPGELRVAFSGRVADVHGKPISNASVILSPARVSFQSDHQGVYKATIPRGVTFARDGNYVVGPDQPNTTYELIATHSDYSDSDRVTVRSDVKQVNFTLKPLGAIEGRVVAARTGQPVTDFRIRPELGYDPAPTTLEADFKRVRDDQGRFRLERIKAGLSTISVGAKGFADTTITFPPVLAGETRERVEVRLEPGAVLQGQVVGTDGRALRLARVSGGYPRRGAITDSEGNFAIDSLPTGPFEVTAKHESYAPKTVTVVLGNGSVNRTRIVMTSGTVLEGEFTQGGKGVPGEILVYLERETSKQMAASGEFPPANEPVLRAKAGEDGHFQIREVPDGPLRIEGVLEMPGCWCTWRKTIKLAAREDTTHTVDFHFPANDAIVEGTVYVASEKPLVGFGTLFTTYADFTPEGETSIVVNAKVQQGRYSVCLPGGRTRLYLHVESEHPYDGPRSKDFDVELNSGDHIARDIFLYGGATLTIRVGGPVRPQPTLLLALRGEIVLGETITKESLASIVPGGQSMVEPSGMAKMWGLEPGPHTICAVDVFKGGDAARVLGYTVVNVEKDAKMDVELTVPEQ